MTPTQECTSSGLLLLAGLMGLLLLLVHRCSMGECAGMPRLSISASSSSMYAMSLCLLNQLDMDLRGPTGNATYEATQGGARLAPLWGELWAQLCDASNRMYVHIVHWKAGLLLT